MVWKICCLYRCVSVVMLGGVWFVMGLFLLLIEMGMDMFLLGVIW